MWSEWKAIALGERVLEGVEWPRREVKPKEQSGKGKKLNVMRIYIVPGDLFLFFALNRN